MFWILYLYGGVSDLFDGPIARKLKQQSNFGAKLDSIADLSFLIAIVIVLTPYLVIPIWIWICVGAIVLIRIASYMLGYKKYHTFSSLHTYANKITGAFLFGTPVLYMVFGIIVTGIILCLLAFVSSIEELMITVKYKELNRDIKSILVI